MLKLTLAAVAALATLSTGAFAADLVNPVKETPQIADPVGSGFYAELFGGSKLAGEVDYFFPSGGSASSDPLNAGLAFGAAVGMETGISGLSVELDVLHTSVAYRDISNTSVDTLSLMANAKYAFKLTDGFDIYAAAGVGAIHGSNVDSGTTYIDTTAGGYQLIAGVSADITPNIGLLAEYRYQNTFAPFPSVNPPLVDSQTFANSVVLVGVKLSTN